MAEHAGYNFDAETWKWPDSVSGFGVKAAPAPIAQIHVAPQAPDQNPGAKTPALDPNQAPAGEASLAGGVVDGSGAGKSGAETGQTNIAPATNPSQQGAGEPSTSGVGTEPLTPAQTPAAAPTTPASPKVDAPTPAPNAVKAPIIMVTFKMGGEAKKVFTGELVLNAKAKSTNSAVVAYLADLGREERVEVPLKFIELVSINHQ
jgi:hypothetical protein